MSHKKSDTPKNADLEEILIQDRPVVVILLKKQFPYIDDHFIEDAANETARTAAETFNPRRSKSIGAWWAYLAQRKVIDLLRRESRHRHAELSETSSADAPGPDDIAISKEISELVHTAMSHLSELERHVTLADLDAGGRASSSQLAEWLSVSLDAVYRARFRARRKLQSKLLGVWKLYGKEDK